MERDTPINQGGSLHRTSDRWVLTAILVLAAAGSAIVLILTSQAMGTTSDGVNYIMSARSLLAERDYLACSRAPLVLQPPLYPTVLAVSGLLGIEPFAGARLINAVTVGLIIFASGWLFRTYLRSPLFVVLATFSVAIAWPILISAIFVLSEPIFTLLCLLFVIQLRRVLLRPSLGRVAALVVLASLGWLERYIGVSLVLIGGLAMVFAVRGQPFAKRLGIAIGFGVVSSLLPGLWLLRNYLLTGRPMGNRPASLNNVGSIPDVIASWFDPASNNGVAFLIGLTLIVVIILTLYYGRYRRFGLRGWNAIVPLPVVLFLTLYSIFFVGTVALSEVSIDNRMLSPVYPFLMCVIFVVAEALAERLDKRLPGRIGTVVVAGMIIGALSLPVGKLQRELNLLPLSDEWAGFSTVAFQRSAVTEWAMTASADATLFSNLPYPICLHANRYAGDLRRDNAERAAEQLDHSEQPTVFLTLYDPPSSRYELRYRPEDLSTVYNVEQILATDDDEEGVWRLERRATS